MNVRMIVFARIAAWAVGAGAVAAVIVGFQSLPSSLPLTWWTTVPKTPLIALRIPLINVLTIALIEFLSPGLHRANEFNRVDAVISVLFLTAAAKTGIEAVGILASPVSSTLMIVPLAAVLVAGLGTAAFLGRRLLDPKGWRSLRMSRPESFGAAAAIAGIVILNLPLMVR